MCVLTVLMGQAGGDAEVHQANLSYREIHEEVRRLDVFNGRAYLVDVSQCCSDSMVIRGRSTSGPSCQEI